MSRINIERYYNEIDKIIQYGGSKKETAIRGAFQKLLNTYCEPKDFILITELDYKTPSGTTVLPDGTVKDALRLDWGYWESKDTYDDLDLEIEKKLEKGYPRDNIVFEDSQTAILIQGGEEKLRIPIRDETKLDRLLTTFIDYERPEVRSFREAIEKFKEDIPTIVETLRDRINDQAKTNLNFQRVSESFLKICQETINPAINYDDIREMIIQHILTDEIFTHVYEESHFHKENNIARELQKVIDTFFTGQIRRDILSSIESYYFVIKREGSSIPNYREKQKFLKVIYENFYKAYNPKGADRLGIIYTPDEIVNFMIESTDYLLYKHFGKLLSDENIHILDPATGTGTFITDLMYHIPGDKLDYKYDNEIHANEVAILPYYIANLNIEYTFKQRLGRYKEFKNICFVDTLDNMGFGYKDKQEKLFGLSLENLERIQRQNEKEITVIIGNPPYNANQQNFNDFNKNREYPEIDQRIKKTFVKESSAQKTKVYDMYSRFYRWAMDRIKENGIIAFVTNRSFIDSRTFDGFRKSVEDNFQYYYIVDTKSDVRQNPKIAGTTHNVFGIQTGVAISFLVKKAEELENKCQIYYYNLQDEQLKQEKLNWLNDNKIQNVPFKHVQPSKKHDWINLAQSDFDNLLPLVNKEVKFGRSREAIFELFSLGVVTNRDDWVYDFDKKTLDKKVEFFITTYNENLGRDNLSELIKWTRAVKKDLENNKKYFFDSSLIIKTHYRPFVMKYLYFSQELNEMQYQNRNIFGLRSVFENNAICLNTNFSKKFHVVASDKLVNNHFNGDSQCLPIYRYDSEGNRFNNITDWGLGKLQANYRDNTITKESIFYYTYGVLHNPVYRKKYELNLKRDFPRIPFYKDFWKWSDWGKELMNLHIDYENVEPYALTIRSQQTDKIPKPKLKAEIANNKIVLDDITTISDMPSEAWDYKLGNRSALEWILDQYKEKRPSDETIRKQFNTYKFADYKEHVIDLIKRVCTVSVRTVEIIKEMEKEES